VHVKAEDTERWPEPETGVVEGYLLAGFLSKEDAGIRRPDRMEKWE
jgi:hypothetical protein